MNRLPFPKGVWLSLITAVAIAGIMTAGVVASLGCGGGGSGGHGNGGNDEPEALNVDATMIVQVVTSAWVPVSGQTVYFKWPGATSASGATLPPPTSSHEVTADNGWTASNVYVTIPRNSNLKVSYWLADGDSSSTMWTWDMLLELRPGPTTTWARVSGRDRLFMPGGGLEDP